MAGEPPHPFLWPWQTLLIACITLNTEPSKSCRQPQSELVPGGEFLTQTQTGCAEVREPVSQKPGRRVVVSTGRQECQRG